MTEHDERLLVGEEDEEYLEDYHYQDWGVDRVDLDFKSGKHITNDLAREGECITWNLPPLLKLSQLSKKLSVLNLSTGIILKSTFM